ncbi:hypothetical protein BCB68_00230 [Leptotrichia sp. oral taxon 498]|uniref:MliC family protein n=1 Tax=Leptotrichia sp. oral taxon 498 TaxID=712368 RepID=UPI000B8CAF90|nr:MliC family protein [Leptotrichia sp. oral taxon 498]ASQ47535.1 hypothetical protein BCB68_00230 [Leptotrichia sp. oral taxon 498]
MKSTKKMILATLIGVMAIASIGYSAISRSSRKKTAATSKNLTRKFSCSSRNVTVENLSTNKVRLTDDTGKVYNLKLTRSASGEEYKGNGISIQIKGNDAVFTSNGNDESCNLTSNENSNNGSSNQKTNLLRKFSCDGYQDITVENLSTDKVKLADGYGTIYNLDSTVSGSGEKYSDGNVSIQIKEKEAIYTENGKDKNCALKSNGHGSIEE